MSKLKLLLAIFLLNITAALAEPKINARTAIVVDYHSDEVLYELDPDAQIYPASMTKIMTSIIAFDLLKKIDYRLMINSLFLRTLGDYLKADIHQCLLW